MNANARLLAFLILKLFLSSWINFAACADKSEHVKGSACEKLADYVRLTPPMNEQIPWNIALGNSSVAVDTVMFCPE